MGLLRVGDFRLSKPVVSVELTVEEESPSLDQSISVSRSLLRDLQLDSGSCAWIVTPSKRVTVRLILDQDKYEENGGWSRSNTHHISVSSQIATNLGLRYDCRVSITVQLLPCDSICDAMSVRLVVYGAPVRVEEETSGENIWPLPPSKSLLQRDCLISAEQNGETFFYQIVECECGPDWRTDCAVVGTKTTRYTLVQPSPSFNSPKLPSLQGSGSTPYPDLSRFRSFFESITAESPPEGRILHIVGSDTAHDLSVGLSAASKASGRRYIRVHGLAAFAYSKGVKIGSGGLTDKLSGLGVALELAQKRSPSLLHLHGLDEEWATSDEELNRDAQDRMWSLISDNLNIMKDQSGRSSSTLANVPSILVVVSTAQPMNPGPFAERLVYAALESSLPNTDYIEYLWHQTVVDTLIPNSQLGLLYERMHRRPVNEIEQLRLAYLEEYKSGKTEPFAETVDRLCQEVDRRRRQQRSKIPSVHWEDVGGLAHVRQEILETIELPLKYPHLLKGSTGRTGILLYGPPGTGKTLVAKAVATECKLPFLSVKGPELLGSYVGESEGHVKELFLEASKLASQNAPNAACVLFFDELDSLAPRRGDQSHGGGSVLDRVVATLLVELDRASSDRTQTCIFCMGATNRPDLLDPALLRPGRLDRLVFLGASESRQDQARILTAQLRQAHLEYSCPNDLVERVVALLPGLVTGADISAVVSRAHVEATRRLCSSVESEFQRKAENGDAVTIDGILSSWDNDELTPKLTLLDLEIAAQELVPSVTPNELEKYEKLHGNIQAGNF